MKIATLMVTLLLVVAVPCIATPMDAKPCPLSNADRSAVMRGTFTVVTSTAQIPHAVRQEFARLTHAKHMAMADPGQPFNATDDVMGNYPFRRLALAAFNANYCIIDYANHRT
jgi:hypothetical protein